MRPLFYTEGYYTKFDKNSIQYIVVNSILPVFQFSGKCLNENVLVLNEKTGKIHAE